MFKDQSISDQAVMARMNSIDREGAGSTRLILVGAVSILVGILWDISWHRTIGRDDFWTPAHLAIYLGGLLGGFVGGGLILRASFFRSSTTGERFVQVLGLRGPFGAWLCVWGALAMLTSAPFDDWWHGAYGLDVKILSPPHTVLALGMWAVVLGALFLHLRDQNRYRAETMEVDSVRDVRNHRCGLDQWLVVAIGGILLAMVSVFLTEYSWPNDQRGTAFYVVSCTGYPLYLVAFGRATRLPCGATLIAAVYMLIFMLQGWLLPLFSGEPRLGPVYNPVDRFVPLAFPLLLVVPAVGIDLLNRVLRPGRNAWRAWIFCLLAAVVFTGLFVLSQWHFSRFLISDAAGGWFFFSDRHWGYSQADAAYRYRFWAGDTESILDRPVILAVLVALAFVKIRLGLWLGNWMGRVQR